MPGLREFGVAGAALALTGGVVYMLWKFRGTAKNQGEEKVAWKQEAEEPEESVGKETGCEASSVSGAPEGDLGSLDAVTNAAGHHGEVMTSSTSLWQDQTTYGQLLVLGLDGAGKTSLVQCFVTGSTEQDVAPTQGCHAVSVNKEGLHIEFLEIGGEEKLREYWHMYLEKAQVLVFVLDAADSTRFPQAKTCLFQLLAVDPYLPLVLLANKQDLAGACGVTELYESMALGSSCDSRKLCVLGTQVPKGSSGAHPSVQDAYELILDMMTSN